MEEEWWSMRNHYINLALILIGLQLGIGYVIAAPGTNPKNRVYPDVLKVEVRKTAKGVFSFDVTISSPDTGWKKYANAFRVKAIKGRILGTRILYYPHVNEQPFTRALSGVKIPPDL